MTGRGTKPALKQPVSFSCSIDEQDDADQNRPGKVFLIFYVGVA
jgi:hypothetical protein